MLVEELNDWATFGSTLSLDQPSKSDWSRSGGEETFDERCACDDRGVGEDTPSMPDPAGARDSWRALLAHFDVPHDRVLTSFNEINTRYCEPWRNYHTLEHITEMLVTINALAGLLPAPHAVAGARALDRVDPGSVMFAAWLHDIVYDPQRNDNETASATYARDLLTRLGIPQTTIDETARLIELTAGHEVTPDDGNGIVLADADLAILGSSRDRYDRYARDIRAEYAHVPDDAFRSGRTAVLNGFLGRERIFLTEPLHAKLDSLARANLAHELDVLALRDG